MMMQAPAAADKLLASRTELLAPSRTPGLLPSAINFRDYCATSHNRKMETCRAKVQRRP